MGGLIFPLKQNKLFQNEKEIKTMNREAQKLTGKQVKELLAKAVVILITSLKLPIT